MGFQVNLGQRVEQCPLGAGQVSSSFQVLGQAPGLVQRPGLERGHKLNLVDDPVLQREQPEQKMPIGGGGGHGETPWRDVDTTPTAPPRRGRRKGRIITYAGGLCIPPIHF